jgi:hypothetical protein
MKSIKEHPVMEHVGVSLLPQSTVSEPVYHPISSE